MVSKKEIDTMVSRTADSLFNAAMMDEVPSMAACVDFGLDGPDFELKYGILQKLIRWGLVTADKLHEVVGEALKSHLVKHLDIDVTFTTAYDLF